MEWAIKALEKCCSGVSLGGKLPFDSILAAKILRLLELKAEIHMVTGEVSGYWFDEKQQELTSLRSELAEQGVVVPMSDEEKWRQESEQAFPQPKHDHRKFADGRYQCPFMREKWLGYLAAQQASKRQFSNTRNSFAILLCETRGHTGRRPCEFCQMQVTAAAEKELKHGDVSSNGNNPD